MVARRRANARENLGRTESNRRCVWLLTEDGMSANDVELIFGEGRIHIKIE